MTSFRILICDDRPTRRAEWLESLEALPSLSRRLESVEFDRAVFQHDFATLIRRRTQARPRAGEADEHPPRDLAELRELTDPGGGTDSTIFDRADILVVDYALELLEGDEGYLTGALVAYLARCYSRCGVIVGVNQYGENPFDLTLTGDKKSFADVDVGQAQLANRGLWGSWDEGFRPWTWPIIPDLVELMRARARIAEDHLTDSVLSHLGLADLLPLMPRSALQDLERQGSSVDVTTFEQLARTPAMGLRRGEHPMSVQSLARVAAARVTKWLECAVLPLQDVLIDAPHLAAKNPTLLQGDMDDPHSWAATTTISPEAPGGLIKALARHRFREGIWTTRPTWRWPDVARDESLPGVLDPWSIPTPTVVFCEDLSRFIPRESARRFIMEVGSNTTRWVADPSSVRGIGLDVVDYQPRRRLSL